MGKVKKWVDLLAGIDKMVIWNMGKAKLFNSEFASIFSQKEKMVKSKYVKKVGLFWVNSNLWNHMGAEQADVIFELLKYRGSSRNISTHYFNLGPINRNKNHGK